jgi:hypothetical protein
MTIIGWRALSPAGTFSGRSRIAPAAADSVDPTRKMKILPQFNSTSFRMARGLQVAVIKPLIWNVKTGLHLFQDAEFGFFESPG